MLLSLKLMFIFLLTLKSAIIIGNSNIRNKTTNYSCYTCVEPMVEYSRLFILLKMNLFQSILHSIPIIEDQGSCRFFNATSPMAPSYVRECSIDNYTDEYERRKLALVIVLSEHIFIAIVYRKDCVHGKIERNQ